MDGLAMTLVDDLMTRLHEWLAWLPGDLRGHLVVPIVAGLLLVLPRIVVHRVLPWLGRFLLVPAVALSTGVVVSLMLLADVLFARLFRLFSLPLTAAHHAIGDWAVTGTRSVRGTSRRWADESGRWLRRFNSTLLLVAGAALIVLWSRGYCERHPAAGCVAPIEAWWRATRAVLPDLRVPWG